MAGAAVPMLVDAAVGTTAAVVINRNLNELFGSDKPGDKRKRKIRALRARKKRRPRHGLSHALSSSSSSNMPKRKRNGRRSRGRRRSLYKRKRRRGPKRSRRRSIGRPRRPLRLYPSGFPRTHKIKLRVLKQCIIWSPDRDSGGTGGDAWSGAGWGSVVFTPANCVDPFGAVDDQQRDDIDNHTKLQFTYTDGTDGASPQPYGWDQWMGSGGNGGPYDRAIVEGSKITISFVQGSTASITTQFAVGWTKLMGNQNQGLTASNDNTGLAKFGHTYTNVSRTEVSDLINTGIVKNLSTLRKVGDGARLIGPQTYTYHYSRKALVKRYRRMGVVMPTTTPAALDQVAEFVDPNNLLGHGQSHSFDFNHTTLPAVNPQVRFIIADLGADTATTPLHCIISIEYSLTLFAGSVSQQSIA